MASDKRAAMKVANQHSMAWIVPVGKGQKGCRRRCSTAAGFRQWNQRMGNAVRNFGSDDRVLLVVPRYPRNLNPFSCSSFPGIRGLMRSYPVKISCVAAAIRIGVQCTRATRGSHNICQCWAARPMTAMQCRIRSDNSIFRIHGWVTDARR